MSNITKCKHCQSLHINLSIDKEKGIFQMHYGDIIARAVIYCEDCHRFDFQTVKLTGLQDIQEE